ncbi:MAG TPA: 16S rRNA (cytosine(1402)-N(4))-methyltransferase RsmH [Candidatus Dojkabacteria bacterium]|nr:16S rRNA (cytosine(1402)-N(4))-methyltransferase RsmH [Candidatus Dojkabacteria bacterium]HOV34721.1 16S rRNA (cytosine(1402)-N(4))-methyltransferase RsmH [Candidatus Dojkabacteria bacterium]
MNKIHVPVLLEETIQSLNIQPDGFYIDGTLGDGGHSIEILKKLSNKGLLVSIDHDPYAIDFVKKYYKKYMSQNWKICRSNFKDIDKISQQIGRTPDGIILDLGISSRQLEDSHNRGFSYNEDSEPLDMRMDTTLNVTAKDLLNMLSEKELSYIFKKYGEEKYSSKIAKAIKHNISDINTVGDLKRIIYKVVPADNSNLKNPSRRVFQALRIVVNDELHNLEQALENSFKILNKNGRISIISFHSLEDRIVKKFFLEKQKSGEGILLYKSYIAPTDTEIIQNPRSASAKLRTLIKK